MAGLTSSTRQSPPSPYSRLRRAAALGFSVIVAISIIGMAIALAGVQILGPALMLFVVASAVLAGSITMLQIRRIQANLEKERGLVLEALEGANSGRAICDPDGETVFSSQSFWTLVAPHPEGVSKALEAQYGKDAKTIALIRQMYISAREGKPRGAQFLVQRYPGQREWHDVQARPLPSWPHYVSWRIEDITEHHEALGRIRREQEKLSEFFENAPLGIVAIDSEGRVTRCNRAFSQMLNMDPDKITDKPLINVVRKDDHNALNARLKSLSKRSSVAPLEVHLLGKHEIAAQMYARPMGGEIDAVAVLHFIDVTEQKNLEMQFAQSQKMQAVGQLAGGVAHDFNNLLTAMIGFCDLLLLRHKPGDPSFGDIMQIKQNANRAANLVRQLLAFSRQQTLQPRVLNITDALSDLTNLLRRLIGENIRLKMTHGPDLGPVFVDQGQFEQVIVNLVVNARDAMPTGGSLSITTHNFSNQEPVRRGPEIMTPGDWVMIEVADTGVGIPPENLQRIFEPFFSTKAIGSGTGLGLSTVYGIVRQTGGYVFVDSAPGKGATFTIALPRYQGEEEVSRTEDQKDKEASDLTGAGHVLLVEDEDAVRMFGARALRNKGYQVHEARNAEEALQLLSTEHFPIDLLITDVVMPHMDGPTLVKQVKEKMPDLRVIFISGYAEDRLRQHFIKEHVDFLPKPFSLKQLAAKVKEVMGG